MIQKLFILFFIVASLIVVAYQKDHAVFTSIFSSPNLAASDGGEEGRISFGESASASLLENVSFVDLHPPEGVDETAEEELPNINPEDIPEGFALEDISPYYDRIWISSLFQGSSDFASEITLRASLSGGEAVNVSGWRIQSHRHGSKSIPRAITVYDPLGFAPEEDIKLRDGEYLVLYSGKSLLGRNVRINSCMGYLENHIAFDPSLGASCPSPDYEKDKVYLMTAACQDYIYTLRTCDEPESNPPIRNDDYACRAYLEELNYRGCYDRHRGDEDFLSNEWRAWIGDRFLDERHDRVLLYDTKGRVVDEYIY